MKIASLLASGTEIVCGLGLADSLVAISHECDFPPQILDRPRVTRTRVDPHAASAEIDAQVRATASVGEPLYEVDFERLASLSPELIITQAQCDVCAVRYEDVANAVAQSPSLERTQVVALNPRRLGDILTDIRRVGRVAQCETGAAAYVAQLEQRIERVRKMTQDLPFDARPRVACLEWCEPPMLAANWMPELVELAGGRAPDSSVAGQHSNATTWDEVESFDPQVVLIMPCGIDLQRAISEARSLPELPQWPRLSAVQSGKVYAVDGNAYFNRSGPRIIDSLEILAYLLHPDRFAAPCAQKEPAWSAVPVNNEG